MRSLVLAALALTFTTGPGAAQDFSPAAPPGSNGGAAGLLEDGLAHAGPTLEIASGAVRWLGLPELGAHSLAASGRWRSVVVAAGVSATGDQEGWRGAGLGAGYAGTGCGVAARTVWRSDASAEAPDAALGRGAGLEAGAGAWIRAGRGLTVWTSHPQIFVRGIEPPLRRGHETGVRYAADGCSAWLASRVAGQRRARHRGGLELGLGAASVWLEARDDPLRTGFGLMARARVVTVGVAVDSHPVLGDTFRLSISLARRSPDEPEPAP